MTASNRKSRPLRRKTSHSVIERRRREKINEGLIHLQSTVPACQQELRELLECKVKMAKKSKRKQESSHDIQSEVDLLLEEKMSTQMVLEKLCIISHTVDYVQELQTKVQAYEKLCRCSPKLPETQPGLRSHDEVHANGSPSSSSVSPHIEVSDGTKACHACVTAKRHWGSNKPMQLVRPIGKIEKVRLESVPERRIAKRKASSLSDLEEDRDDGKAMEQDDDGSDSDLELDDWQSGSHLCAQHLYTNNRSLDESTEYPLEPQARKRRATFDSFPITKLASRTSSGSSVDRDGEPLNLLAQVSAEEKRALSPSCTMLICSV